MVITFKFATFVNLEMLDIDSIIINFFVIFAKIPIFRSLTYTIIITNHECDCFEKHMNILDYFDIILSKKYPLMQVYHIRPYYFNHIMISITLLNIVLKNLIYVFQVS